MQKRKAESPPLPSAAAPSAASFSDYREDADDDVQMRTDYEDDVDAIRRTLTALNLVRNEEQDAQLQMVRETVRQTHCAARASSSDRLRFKQLWVSDTARRVRIDAITNATLAQAASVARTSTGGVPFTRTQTLHAQEVARLMSGIFVQQTPRDACSFVMTLAATCDLAIAKSCMAVMRCGEPTEPGAAEAAFGKLLFLQCLVDTGYDYGWDERMANTLAFVRAVTAMLPIKAFVTAVDAWEELFPCIGAVQVDKQSIEEHVRTYFGRDE